MWNFYIHQHILFYLIVRKLCERPMKTPQSLASMMVHLLKLAANPLIYSPSELRSKYPALIWLNGSLQLLSVLMLYLPISGQINWIEMIYLGRLLEEH